MVTTLTYRTRTTSNADHRSKPPRRMQPAAHFRLAVATLAACLALLFPQTKTAHAGDDDISKLESLVDQLISLRKQKRAVQAQWNEEQRVLSAERELLQEHNSDLRNTADKHAGRIKKLKARKQQLRKKKKKLRQTVNRLSDTVAGLEEELLAMQKKLPGPLREDLSSQFDQLRSADESGPETSLVTRLSACRIVANKIAAFNDEVHLVRQILDPPAEHPREMKVLYIGLSNAFGVGTSRETELACRGVPTDNGWKWTWNKDWAPRMRKCLRAYDPDEPAAFTDLPFLLTEPKE